MPKGSRRAFFVLGILVRSFRSPLEIRPVCFARPTCATRSTRSILSMPSDLPLVTLVVLRTLHVPQTTWDEWPQQYLEYAPYDYQPMKTDPESMGSSSWCLSYKSDRYKDRAPCTYRRHPRIPHMHTSRPQPRRCHGCDHCHSPYHRRHQCYRDQRASDRHRQRQWGRMTSQRRDLGAWKVHRCALHSTLRFSGFASCLRSCLWMACTCSPRSARSTCVTFHAVALASRVR